MKKMTTTQLKQYVIAEAKRLMRADMLKEEKAKILGQLKKLNEGEADIHNPEELNVLKDKHRLNNREVDEKGDELSYLKGAGNHYIAGAVSNFFKQISMLKRSLSEEELNLVIDSMKNQLEWDMVSGNKRIHPEELDENNEDGGWTTSIMNVSEVDDFITNYLEGWNLQYDAPVDLGNGKVSIRYQEETEDVMNQMNHQDAEERLSNMDDKSNYSMNEDSSNLRATLHTLVGNEMRLGKRADMHGGVDWQVEEHKKAEEELEMFLLQNPSMLEFVEEVEEHFSKRLYR